MINEKYYKRKTFYTGDQVDIFMVKSGVVYIRLSTMWHRLTVNHSVFKCKLMGDVSEISKEEVFAEML